MYLINFSEGKTKCNEIVYHFYIKFTNTNYCNCFCKVARVLCPFGRKVPDVRKSRDKKIECFNLGEVGVIQRHRAAVSVSTLRNDVKRSV